MNELETALKVIRDLIDTFENPITQTTCIDRQETLIAADRIWTRLTYGQRNTPATDDAKA